MIFIPKMSKGHNSVKNVGGVWVLVLCPSTNEGLICTKFHENILDGIKVIEWTRFLYQKKGGISP